MRKDSITGHIDDIDEDFNELFILLQKRSELVEDDALNAKVMQHCINQILKSPEYKKLRKYHQKLSVQK